MKEYTSPALFIIEYHEINIMNTSAVEMDTELDMAEE